MFLFYLKSDEHQLRHKEVQRIYFKPRRSSASLISIADVSKLAKRTQHSQELLFILYKIIMLGT